MSGIIVTIDGPAGTGKSTVARRLAERLGFAFLNTGAMYRAVGLACISRGVPAEDPLAASQLAGTLNLRFVDNRLWLDGKDVSDQLRREEVTQAASFVAAAPAVRERLVELQRRSAADVDLVTEGRDQGTVVFPDALCKYFLTASPQERARRRQRELQEQGVDMTLELILERQADRDARDERRACGPLQPAADADVIDTSHMSLDEVIDELTVRTRDRISSRVPSGR